MTNAETSQWQQLKEQHIPGLAVTDVPMRMLVYYSGQDGRQLGLVLDMRQDARTPRQGVNIRREIIDSLKVRDSSFQLPTRWSYEQWSKRSAPDARVNTMDLDNPRVYDIKGNECQDMCHPQFLVKTVKDQFEAQLSLRWHHLPGDGSSTPFNKRRERVLEFLDYHHQHGGNAQAFREYISTLARSVDALPRPETDGIALLRSMSERPDEFNAPDLADRQGLRELLLTWLKGAQVVQTVKENDPNAWPDLKKLALFHAYRVEAGDDSADITPTNAQQVAHDAGHTSRSSGKTLLENFRKYAHGLPEDKRRERTRDGRPGDVAKRFDVVLPRLSAYPEALKIAEADRRFLRTRANGRED